MEAVQVQQVMARDGEILITGLPYKRGQAVEVIIFLPPTMTLPPARLTVGQLRRSGLIGLWQDREDIGDSSVYPRQLREQAQERGDIRLYLARERRTHRLAAPASPGSGIVRTPCRRMTEVMVSRYVVMELIHG